MSLVLVDTLVSVDKLNVIPNVEGKSTLNATATAPSTSHLSMPGFVLQGLLP